MEKGDVFVISAPSGSGKTPVCGMLLQRMENIELSISYTTRPRKQGETDGKDYYFIKPEKFDKILSLREFLESASVYGNRYGTSREAVRAIVSRGRDAAPAIEGRGGQGGAAGPSPRGDTPTVVALREIAQGKVRVKRYHRSRQCSD